MTGGRRNFLRAAMMAAGAAIPGVARAQGDGRATATLTSNSVRSQLRVKSLESLLVEKGLVDRAALDALVDTFENKVGPRNGARVVAQRLGRRCVQAAIAGGP